MARYKIWKKSIEEYNILDTVTNKLTVLSHFILTNAEFKVDFKNYLEAQKRDFKNSGDTYDYFAWIEAENVREGANYLPYTNTVWYNPFKHHKFRDRETLNTVNTASSVVVKGNYLTYIK